MRGIHSIFAVVLLSSGMAQMASAQIVTNWAAYNDHRAGPIRPPHVPTATSWGTALRVTTYDLGAPTDVLGVNLTNFLTGEQLPVTMSVIASAGDPDDFPTVVPMLTNTPGGALFFGICDLSNNGIVGVDAGLPGGGDTTVDTVTFTFNNLNPAKRYLFRGTSCRGNNYALRWAVATLTGATDWIDAHINGNGGPGVLTSNNFPANLGPGQAAWNSGHNREGAVVGWDFISPAPDGSFSLVVAQYVGSIPGGLIANDVNYGYSFGAILLAEVETSAVAITTNPPPLTTVEQNRPFSLSVSASGTPIFYQWHKQGGGPIPGATMRTYSVAQAALGDSGDYFAVVYNPLNSVTSTLARVNVFADTNSPFVETALSFPSFDMATQVATLDQVVVEFNEAVQPAGAGNPFNYSISGGGGGPVGPVAVTVTNNRAVILKFPAPLMPDFPYLVHVSGVLDLVGNNIINVPIPFRTGAQGACNGLLFEAYDTGAGVTVDILTGSPNFPDNPSFRTTLWAFDTRVVYPDDSHGGYGSRIRGVFIPPLSGNWKFFLRCFDRGQFFINPNGLDPAGKQLLLEELTGNPPRNWNKILSGPIPLRAGRAYYIESLQQADLGTGTDVIKVAARLEGTDTPMPNDAPDTNIDANAISGPFIGFPYLPRGIAGSFTVVQQPTDVSTQANERATFTIVISAPQAPYICYQWQRSDDGGANFNDIPGATKASYTTGFLTVADDNNDRYRVIAGIPGESAVSSVARLTVGADTTDPRVTRVVAINATNIVVFFSEPLSATGTSVVDPDTYRIDDGASASVGSALISPANSLRVDLFLSEAGFPLTLGNTYTLRVSTDSTPLADDTGNPLNPDPTFVTFRAQNYSGNVENLITLPTTGLLPVGSLTERGFAGRIVQVATAKPNGNAVTESVLAGTFIDPGTSMPALNIAPAHVFYETNAINYNKDMPTGTSVGSLLPDSQFPGFPPNPTGMETAGYENIVMEVVAYLHLHPGIYQFGVNSDDGFRVSPAAHVDDVNNSISLGEFNGGRGVADTIFDFYVAREGLYPFRLIWEQGNAGAALEWWEVDLGNIAAPRIAINANPPAPPAPGLAAQGGGGPPAFVPPCTGKTMSVSRAGNNLVITWPIAGGGNLFALQGTPSLTPPIAWSFVPQIPQNVAGNKRVIIPLGSQNQFYRLYKAAPPNCP